MEAVVASLASCMGPTTHSAYPFSFQLSPFGQMETNADERAKTPLFARCFAGRDRLQTAPATGARKRRPFYFVRAHRVLRGASRAFAMEMHFFVPGSCALFGADKEMSQQARNYGTGTKPQAAVGCDVTARPAQSSSPVARSVGDVGTTGLGDGLKTILRAMYVMERYKEIWNQTSINLRS